MHSTTKPGILCMAVHPENDNLVITGGNDNHALIFDNKESKVTNKNSFPNKYFTFFRSFIHLRNITNELMMFYLYQIAPPLLQ